jgi:ABC-type antimicrobial peptide transport system ATPase subunit
MHERKWLNQSEGTTFMLSNSDLEAVAHYYLAFSILYNMCGLSETNCKTKAVQQRIN